MIWWSGLMALFLFFLAKLARSSSPTAHFVALGPPFPIWQAQCVQDFPLKHALFSMLSASWQHQQVGHFSSPLLILLLYPRHTVISSVFSFTSNSQAHLAGTVASFLLYYQTTMDSWTPSFLLGNDAADELAR